MPAIAPIANKPDVVPDSELTRRDIASTLNPGAAQGIRDTPAAPEERPVPLSSVQPAAMKSDNADPWAQYAPKDAKPDPWAQFNPQPLPINPGPAAFHQRVAQGQALNQTMDEMAKVPNSQRIANWTANALRDGDYASTALGTVATLATRIQEMFESGATLAGDVREGKVYAGGLHASDFTDDPTAREPLETLITRSQDMAMTGGVRSTFEGMSAPKPLIFTPEGKVARLITDPDTGTLKAHVLGDAPPKQTDFANAATNIAADTKAETSTVEQNLRAKWEEEGKLPSELSADSKTDAFLAHELSSAATPPEDMAPLVSPIQQPLSPSGSLVELARKGIDEIAGLGKNIDFMTDPMSTGSDRAMVIGKDTISNIRRAEWDEARYDNYAKTQFPSREQRARMFDAMDEESVGIQKGESREHQGLATLDPHERMFVEAINDRQQAIWRMAVDEGIAEGEGIPMHATRMVLGIAANEDRLALDTLGRNVKVRTPYLRERKHLTVEETEAAAKAKFGEQAFVARDIRAVIASTAELEKAVIWKRMINSIKEVGDATGEPTVTEGIEREGTFTLNHPAFRVWKPDFVENPVTGKIEARLDESGKTVFRADQLRINNEFEGPLRSIMDEPRSKSPYARAAMAPYDAAMWLKGKSMTMIMNSPLIHNFVVWGKVAPSVPGEWLGIRTYFKGNAVKNDPVRSSQLVERGLTPVGNRGSYQDISSQFETPSLIPGRSLTSKITAALATMDKVIPGKEAAAEQRSLNIREAFDKAGDFWHGTLLWDRVADVQFGIAQHLSDKLTSFGTERIVADRIATHFANTIVGAMPKEAMSAGMRAFFNIALFSRSFTIGNMQVVKMAGVGIPKPIMAQIARDMGEHLPEEGGLSIPEVGDSYLNSLGKRRALGSAAKIAIGIIAVDYAMSKIVNSMLQNGINVTLGNSNIAQEVRGYAERLKKEWEKIKVSPIELLHPLDLVDRLTPMSSNPTGKENRIFIGTDKYGNEIFGRNPMGKYPEEVVGWASYLRYTLRSKLNPPIGGLLDVLTNSDAYGRKITQADPKGYYEQGRAVLQGVGHIVARHFPEGQIQGGYDLLMNQGDPTINKLRLFSPFAGFTTSTSPPAGKTEAFMIKDRQKAEFDMAWPGIRKMIQGGDITGARKIMANQLHMSMHEQVSLERYAKNPSYMSGRSVRDAMQHGTPEEVEKFKEQRRLRR